MDRLAGVYAIVNSATGRRYVGSSVNIAHRWLEHLSRLRCQRHTAKDLQRDWSQVGSAGFQFVILELVAGTNARLIRERFYLHATENPYNALKRVVRGPEPGYRHRPESIAKMRAANLGKPKSAEHRARLSTWRKGRKFPKHAEAMRGRKATPETREKMRQAHLRIPRTAEWSQHLSEANRGRVIGPEWGAKISAAKKGRPWSAVRRLAFNRRHHPDRCTSVVPTTLLEPMAERAIAIANPRTV